jgi:ubiquinone/menaquinone biosynthesis C-methylase UbiE
MSEYEDKSVLDFCCGIGISTTKNGIGIDTSSEMLNVAKRTYPNKVFYNSNSETFKPDKKIDVVSCMFAFHEMPQEAHIKIINNAIQIAKKEVVIVDIASNYVPKQIMLSGEPYLLDYLNNIDETLKSFNKTVYIDKHVNIWKYFP